MTPAPQPETLPLWIARLAGDQPTMGRQHGALIAEAGGVDRALDHYRDMPERMLVGNGPGVATRLARAAVTAGKELYLARLDRDRVPELRARSIAFMEAAGKTARDARYVGVMDVFQGVVGLAGRLGVGPFAPRARALA
ncbi:MAG: hypothetical protein KC464_18715, partial [Myxococcales bacterium]|nr:hypothetical protein [Myxococcales bacterium]